MSRPADGFVSPTLEIAKRNKLMLGFLLPLQSGAWSPSLAPRETSWEFGYIAECSRQAEALGFDLVFGLAQWMGKGGYGGSRRSATFWHAPSNQGISRRV